jgi:hypothetical protein
VTRSDDRFGELRSLLQRAPDPQTWGELCALLDAWPEDASLTEIALPYCEAHMRGWQDAWRVAPKRWITRLISGHPLPTLALARRIRVHTPLIDRDRVAMITRHPALATLTHLDVSNTQLGDGAYDLLSALAHHNTLTSLDLSYNDELIPIFTRWLSTKPAGPPLERLIFCTGYNQQDEWPQQRAMLVQLAQSALITQLRRLEMTGMRYFPFDALGQLAHAATRLDSLRMSGHMDVSALSQPIWSQRLRHLALHNSHTIPSNIHTLREAYATLGALRSLELSKSGLTDDLLSTLFSPLVDGHTWQLTSLDVSNNHLGDSSVEFLLDQPWFPQLQHLDLSSNLISDTGALALISSPRLHPHARVLLNGNGLDELTHAAIATAAALRSDLASTGERWRAAAMDPNDPWWIA